MSVATMRASWLHLALGSAGVMIISVLYFLSPPELVGANLGQDLAAAQSLARAKGQLLPWIGLAGIIADPAIAIGAFALASSFVERRMERAALGMYWLAMAAVIFTLVDLVLGFAVPSCLAAPATFALAKHLFDALTGAAAFAYGVSALLLARESDGLASPALSRALFVVGALVAVAGLSVLLRLDVALPLGAGLTTL
ncbi:MAG: hypothetical protein JWN04_1396, partial [Myxococcaceae bacterium]|nr:hypothetical protein [Myxococcaceae bacterium]